MKKIINAGKYDIIIEKNSLCSFGEYVKTALGTNNAKLLIVSDDRVYSLYGDRTR